MSDPKHCVIGLMEWDEITGVEEKKKHENQPCRATTTVKGYAVCSSPDHIERARKLDEERRSA